MTISKLALIFFPGSIKQLLLLLGCMNSRLSLGKLSVCVVNTDSSRDDSNVIEFGSDPSTSCSSVQRISNIRPGTIEDDTFSFHLVFIAQLEDKRTFTDELHQKKRKKP